MRATPERHASVERAPHDAVLAITAATKKGTFHSDGDGDGAHLHRGARKQGLINQTAAATAHASTNHLPPRC
jgi:hypothetical protein